MVFDIHFLIILLGAVQGSLLAVFLFTRRNKKHKSNIILALLMLLYSVSIVIPELAKNFHEEIPHILSSSDPVLYLFGPLIYFYSVFLTGRSNKFSKKDLLHYLPFVFTTLVLTPFYIQSGDEKLAFYRYVEQTGLPAYFVIGWSLACLHVALYMFFTLRVIKDYRSKIKNNYSSIEKVNLNWLNVIVIGNMVIWILDAAILILYMVGLRVDVTGVIGQILSYTSSIFIYFIGYKALSQPEVFAQMKPEKNQGKERVKYYGSGLTPSKSQEYKESLLEFMKNESPHLNPDIQLGDLSEALSVPNNHLSQVVNEKFGQNFFDFINSYRVEEAKGWLQDPVRNQATMLAIAFESGFKSKSTFNAAFKKHQGQTPSEYKKQQSALKTA